MLAAGSGFQLRAHQAAFEAARTRLLLEPPSPGVASFLGAVALARMGFTRRAEDRLAQVWSRVRRDGSLPGDAEDAAALAWATAEVVRWSGNTAWARAHLRSLRRLLEHLAREEARAGGVPCSERTAAFAIRRSGGQRSRQRRGVA